LVVARATICSRGAGKRLTDEDPRHPLAARWTWLSSRGLDSGLFDQESVCYTWCRTLRQKVGVLGAENFRLIGCQTVIYTPGLNFRTTTISGHLMSGWADRFNGEPLLIPTMEDAPPSVPRLVLKSSDSKYRLQAGPTRLDLFWEATSDTDVLDTGSHLQFSTEVIRHYLEVTRASVGRLAAVLKRIATNDAPAMTLARHFCRDRWLAGPLNRPSDFQLHARKCFDLPNSFRVNSWFRCKTAQVGKERAPAILVEQDFNTLAEELESRDYGPEQIGAFFSPTLIAEFDRVLELYFPKE